MKNIDLAKEIFMKYRGSYFHMERDGEYNKYLKFRITKEQEKQWMDEYQSNLLSHVMHEYIASPEFMRLTDALSESNNITYITSLLVHIQQIKDNVDTFTILLMSEGIMDIANNYRSRYIDESNKLIIDICSLIIDILSEAVSKAITVASYYHGIINREEVLTDDNIIARIRRLLNRAEEKRANQIKRSSLGY